MMRIGFGGTLLIVFSVAGLLEASETEGQHRVGWISSEPGGGRPFNPFSLNSWLSVPSQFMQYWFPLFQPAYYPPHLMRPTTPKPSVGNDSQSEKGKDNIFGISDPPGDSVEYLPPGSEIEW